MKKIIKLIFLIVLIVSVIAFPVKSQDDVEYYYSEKFVKNAVFTWRVNQSVNYFEELPENANFTVKLKDPLYPGPMTIAELNKVYITIDVNGEQYSGNGFPLFWHIRQINGSIETDIREEFENSPDVFNVSTITSTLFRAEFVILHENYTLSVEMDIDSEDGITKRYYEHFDDNVDLESIIELVFFDYTVAASFSIIGSIFGFLVVTASIMLIKKRKRKK
jgi:hypothetical protein